MKTAVALLAIGALGLSPGAATARRAPVVVELFTAQGCVSCDKADAVAAKLAARPDTIVLTWPVDYWDYLGWKDTLALPDSTERQKAYDRRLGLRDVYTPQVVVGGVAQTAGDDAGAVDALVTAARHDPAPQPQIVFQHGGRIAVGVGRRQKTPGEVWLIRYDPHPTEVEVKAGDNRGAKVTEVNVVRQAVRLGRWTGRPEIYPAPAADQEGLRELVIVQEVRGGRILGAREQTP